MIVEHALLQVHAGQEDVFESSMIEALPIIRAASGCHGAEVRRQIEDPNCYLLLVTWESVDAHMVGFRQSADFERWRELTHPFYVERPLVTHFNEPLSS